MGPLVTILLSTYNGEVYLRDQLESILSQTHKNIYLIVRDDGSTDSTVEILQSYAHKFRLFSLVEGENIGVVKSFMELLNRAPSEADYIAFCDQDDVWDLDKIANAVEAMEREGGLTQPRLYFTPTRIVDSKLGLISEKDQVKKGPSFYNSLVQNVVTGCTAVINQEARKLLVGRDVNWSNVVMHDWWVYQVVSAFGEIVYSPRPSISYRQHENNVVGARSGFAFWSKRIKRHFFGQPKIIRAQIEEFTKVYGQELPQRFRDEVELFLYYLHEGRVMGRAYYLVRSSFYRQGLLDNIVFKFLYVVGRI